MGNSSDKLSVFKNFFKKFWKQEDCFSFKGYCVFIVFLVMVLLIRKRVRMLNILIRDLNFQPVIIKTLNLKFEITKILDEKANKKQAPFNWDFSPKCFITLSGACYYIIFHWSKKVNKKIKIGG